MQTTMPLNCLYADYSAGRLDRKKFEGMIFGAITKRKFRLPGFGKEDYEDFVSWLYPRISRAIDSYHTIGSSFDAYINTSIRLAAKEYRWRELRSNNAEAAAWIAQLPDMYACEREFEYYEVADIQPPYAQIALQAEMLGNIKNSRQLLILILKCCRYVSNDFLDKISPKLGMEAEALNGMIDRLKECRKKREARMDSLRELANRQFCRCLFYERTLQLTKDNIVATRRIKVQLGYYRNKLGKTRERLANLRLDPSNAQIAKLLGLTKGAVDATLHTLKRRYVGVKLNVGQTDKDKHILN